MERTLVIIKPSAVQRGLIGEIIRRFERKGLKLVALKMSRMTKEKCAEHYAHLLQKPYFPTLEASMMAAPVIFCCWEGVEAVNIVRLMTGATEGKVALPGTIRGDMCSSHQENIIHTSDSVENAKIELDRFFSEEDYFEYDSPLVPFIYSSDEL